MVKKGLAVWIFSTLSFIAAIHAFEAGMWLFLNREPILLRNYPIINKLNIDSFLYFFSSAAITFLFWGVTCIVALENPIEKFLNHILSDAKKQTELEAEFIDENKTILDMISETLTENSKLLAQIRDLTYNVRAEISAIKPLTEGIEKISSEMEKLKREVKKIKVEIKKPGVCPTCGKAVQPDFNICPYCGENLKLIPQKIIKAYK